MPEKNYARQKFPQIFLARFARHGRPNYRPRLGPGRPMSRQDIHLSISSYLKLSNVLGEIIILEIFTQIYCGCDECINAAHT